MTRSTLPQYVSVTFGSCILFTHGCGVSYACFQESDSDVHTSGLQTVQCQLLSHLLPEAQLCFLAVQSMVAVELAVLCMDGAVLLVLGSIHVLWALDLWLAYHLTDHLFFSSTYSEPMVHWRLLGDITVRTSGSNRGITPSLTSGFPSIPSFVASLSSRHLNAIPVYYCVWVSRGKRGCQAMVVYPILLENTFLSSFIFPGCC